MALHEPENISTQIARQKLIFLDYAKKRRECDKVRVSRWLAAHGSNSTNEKSLDTAAVRLQEKCSLLQTTQSTNLSVWGIRSTTKD
jgi:hypothetical protein